MKFLGEIILACFLIVMPFILIGLAVPMVGDALQSLVCFGIGFGWFGLIWLAAKNSEKE